MKTLEYKIQTEYYRLTSLIGANPSYLIVQPNFIDYLVFKYPLGFVNTGDYEDIKHSYIGMEIIKSEDVKKGEFLLSFSKFDL